MNVTMTVNGQEVTRDVEPRMLLVHFLRDTLDLTGTHWGCDTSNCGACVVHLDGKAVKSCIASIPWSRSRRTASSTRFSRDSTSSTLFSAAFARRA